MADYTTYSRLGAVNSATGASDQKDLFLKLFSGEVLASFDRSTIMQGLVRERNISGGKSATFPLTGRATAGYHSPGEEILPSAINNNETIIDIDGLMYASTFVDDWEDMVNHFDVRSIYAGELGSSLAYNYDRHVMCELVKSARAASKIGDSDAKGASDNIIETSQAAADTATWLALDHDVRATNLAEAIFKAQEKLDNQFVPEGQQRYALVSPADYYAMVQGVDANKNGFSLIHKDYDGAGSYSEGTIVKVGGVTILKSPVFPAGTDVSASGIDAIHSANLSTTRSVVFTSDAVGVVRLLGIGLQTDYQVERQGTLMVARQSVGIGTLRPECAVEIKHPTS